MERVNLTQIHKAIVLPREHGAWAMFIAPLVVGIGTASLHSGISVTSRASGSLLLFAFTAFGFFLLRYPLMMVVKSRNASTRAEAAKWSAIYGVITVVGGMCLMFTARLWSLVPLGILGVVSLFVYLWQAARRGEMSVLGEWTGIAGLCLGAPGAYLTITGRMDERALALYVLNLLYFGGTVLYIKFKVREQPRAIKAGANWRERIRAGRATLTYQGMVTALALVLALVGFVPALAAVAFLPAMCKAIGGSMVVPARLNIRRVGLTELGFTAAFALMILIAFVP